MSQILVVDDEPSICWGLKQALSDEGHDVTTLSSAEQAEQWYAEQEPDVIVMDVRLPGKDGLSAIASLPPRLHDVPVIVMTAFGNLETAVQAIGQGAFEYLTKPFDLDQAVSTITAALKRRASQQTPPTPDSTGLGGMMIGNSQVMQAVFRQIALVAAHDVPVLITGESGTGKELVAAALHQYGSRANGPFIPICVPALSEGLLESELFGHRGGAFTGAVADREGLLTAAHQGTAFFDEMGEITLSAQVKLLRVLETRQVTAVGATAPHPCDFRLIAATNRNLEQMVSEGTFREDLYYRLNVFRIDLPPLRNRREDIPLLARHFLEQTPLQPTGRNQAPVLGEAATAELMQRDWPGNIRELRNAVEHAAVLARDGVIEPEHLPAATREMVSGSRSTDGLQTALKNWLAGLPEWQENQPGLLDRLSEQAEPVLIEHVLEQTQGNRQEAAARLGIHRQTLRDKLRRYGFD